MNTCKLPNGIYTYGKQIGERGGFSYVYEGLDSEGSIVAIKKLHEHVEDMAERELDIVKHYAGSNFRNAISFLDYGWDNELQRYFIVMPKADFNLQEYVELNGKVNENESIRILLDIANGLEELTEIVHRDIKPSNVLHHDSNWKVADFSIAKFAEEATGSKTLRGERTPQYAAPEQFKGETATEKTDLYSLACIFYFLVTGAPPFHSDFALNHIMTPPPELPVADPRIKSLISSMLRKDPTVRPDRKHVLIELEKVINVPHSIPRSKGSEELRRVGAAMRSEATLRDAQDAARKELMKARGILANEGINELMEILNKLVDQVSLDVPEAIIEKMSSAITVDVGKARLYIRAERGTVFPPEPFSSQDIDIICYANIQLSFHDGSEKWSVLLLYCKNPKSSPWQWYDVGFYIKSQPDFFELPPDAEAIGQAIAGTGKFQCAYVPTKISNSGQDRFVDRWLYAIAVFANGNSRQLNFPMTNWIDGEQF